MASTIDEITVEYVEDGVTTVKELEKVVLTKGAWSTIIFKVKTWDRAKQQYHPVSYTIRRYQKRGGEYKARSKFNISSKDQAEKIIEILTKWIAEPDTEE